MRTPSSQLLNSETTTVLEMSRRRFTCSETPIATSLIVRNGQETFATIRTTMDKSKTTAETPVNGTVTTSINVASMTMMTLLPMCNAALVGEDHGSVISGLLSMLLKFLTVSTHGLLKLMESSSWTKLSS